MPNDSQDALISALLSPGPVRTELGTREVALLAYADLLTLAPAEVSVREIAALRRAGLDDRAIHDACAIVAYFAFVNRIADGLGVEIEGSP